MVFFGLFSESGTLGDSCTSMRLRQGVLLSFLYVVFRFSASICYSNASERGSPLPPHGLIALFTESPHGRHDPADSAHQLRLFLSGAHRLCLGAFCVLRFHPIHPRSGSFPRPDERPDRRRHLVHHGAAGRIHAAAQQKTDCGANFFHFPAFSLALCKV